MTYDLAIIGGGPAGVAAGVYAARKKLKTVFITKDWGGQSSVSTGIENWIGTVRLDGAELAKNLEVHLRAYIADTVTIQDGEWVQHVAQNGADFRITTDAGAYDARAVLVATGSARRKLQAKGADRLEHKGITYCASCDGPVFAGKNVAVIGGGNAAFETAAQLLAYCPTVTIIHRRDSFKADEIIVERVLANPKTRVIKNADITEVKGEKFVQEIIYKDKTTGVEQSLAVEGVFVEIGSTPATDFVAEIVKRNHYNQIITDSKTQRASIEGVWAAGDCTDGLYHQNNIAAGDAVKALEDVYLYLHGK
ncbi:MAG: Alkyl hydroperoxide reductase [Parcubacteria group bacterium Gr01-1014_17]|nr:MAG: Alkyl hydroperoxide reductase [Parcubacteria group bacterium Gr01-1014_17]